MDEKDIEKHAGTGAGQLQDTDSDISSEREEAAISSPESDEGRQDEQDGENTVGGEAAAATAAVGKDPFEVGWDGGDNDPLCPRSMHVARKWMIVFITCSAGLCV